MTQYILAALCHFSNLRQLHHHVFDPTDILIVFPQVCDGYGGLNLIAEASRQLCNKNILCAVLYSELFSTQTLKD